MHLPGKRPEGRQRCISSCAYRETSPFYRRLENIVGIGHVDGGRALLHGMYILLRR